MKSDTEIEILDKPKEKVAMVILSGKLTQEDYEFFGPVLEEMIEQQGKIRLMVQMEDFEGWTAGALWKDIKFDLKHLTDVERLAIIGDARWEKGMANFCKPFTTAEVRFYSPLKAGAAQEWLSED